MFKLDTEKELMDAFRPKDRKSVELPGDLKFPLFVRNYLAWLHPAGGKSYLVFSVPGGVPTGIAFNTSGDGPSVPQMCDWCHMSAVSGDVGMITAKISGKRTAGVFVCNDIACAKKIEDEANRNGVSPLPMLATLLERMGRFANEGLGIDLTAAGR